MIIKKIEIGAFGKLEGYKIDLNDAVQVIYGPNEFGKSTLMEFLKIMFYSKRGDKKANSEDKILRQRYTPWSGARMKGSVEFTYKGNLYKIQKEISTESPAKDVTLILNKSTGETIKLGKNEEAGEHFFSLDIKSFERSSYIKNIGKSDFEKTKDAGNAKDSLADKILSNLSDTGEADTSKSIVTQRLNEAIKGLQPSRGIGEISRTQNYINEINQKIYDLKSFEDNRSKLMQELSEVENFRKELVGLQSKVENTEKSRRFSKINDIINLINDKEKQISELKIPFPEADFVIEKLLLEKDKVENQLSKVRELNNIINSVSGNTSEVSESDVNLLNLKLQEKEALESKLKEIDCILKSDINDTNFYCSALQCFDEQEEPKQDLEKLKNKQVDLESSAKETGFELSACKEEFEKSSADFKKKKTMISVLQAVNFLILIISLCAGIFASTFVFMEIYALPFLLFCVGGFYYLKKIKGNQSKIKNISHEALNIENSVRKILIDKMQSMELNLSETEKTMNEILNSKNCSSIHEYYKKHADFQSASKIRVSYAEALEELKNIESNFIENISKYCAVQDFREALTELEHFVSSNSEAVILERKIKLELSVLGLESDDKEFLTEYAKKLYLCTYEKTELSSFELEELRKRIEFLKSLNLEEKYIEIQKNIKPPHDNMENLDKALCGQKSKLFDMKTYLESLQTALPVIEESSDELRKNFNPKLNTRASEIFSCLTGGKYSKLHIVKDYGILIDNDTIDRSCDDFSSGTIDQAYLSLRIAISELISAETRAPIILDDVFMQYDDNRLSKALEFLKDYSLKIQDGCQIIIFTCHKHIADMASSKEMPVMRAD